MVRAKIVRIALTVVLVALLTRDAQPSPKDKGSIEMIQYWLYKRAAVDNRAHRTPENNDILDDLFDLDCHSETSSFRPRGAATEALDKEPANLKELDQLLGANLDKWGIDIFKVHTLSDRHSLLVVVFEIFRRRKLFEEFNIKPPVFIKFLTAIETFYNDRNPFHNSLHAADAVQSLNVLLQSSMLESTFSDLEIMAALLAATILDIDHPGVTNQFLIETEDNLALIYNDQSVTENNSLARGFSIFRDFLADMDIKVRRILRQLIIKMVLSTDPSRRPKLLKKTIEATKDRRTLDNDKWRLVLNDQAVRLTMLRFMIHIADLSYPTKSEQIYHQWINRINAESCLQAEQERALNLESSSVCTRADSPELQLKSIEETMIPLWQTWAHIIQPEGQAMYERVQQYRHTFNIAMARGGSDNHETN